MKYNYYFVIMLRWPPFLPDMGDATTSSSRPITSSSANKETAAKINVTTATKSAAIGVSPPAVGIPLPPAGEIYYVIFSLAVIDYFVRSAYINKNMS